MELKIVAKREGRLSSFLKGELQMSTGLMNKLKWGDAIQVNGQSQHTDFRVVPGDVITVHLDEETPQYPAEAGELTILYEDDHILMVDKPAGMLIHPSRAKFDGTLANIVAGYYARTGQKCAFHPVTRLDRDTFGVVLLAKNAHVHALLQAAPIQKIYHAMVWGGPAEENGLIDAPIARKPLPSLMRFVSPEGKPSQSAYRVLERREQVCKLELRPITGRTHQLRVHCAHMGFPILGDPQYYCEASRSYSDSLGFSTQLLCAYSITFSHPLTGETITVCSETDADKDFPF